MMPLKLMFFIAFCVAIATLSDNVAQTPAAPSTPAAVSRPEDRREFRFLSTSKVATMEKELNERAAEGFRLDRVSKTVLSGDLALLVVRDPSAQEGIHEEYKIISTMRAGTMEKEIVDAGTQGYELRGLISMEPTSCAATTLSKDEIAKLAKLPTLVVFGDHLGDVSFPTWPAALADCEQYVAEINQAGGDATMLHLPAAGVFGNSHMMFQDKNNLQVGDMILSWIDEHVE